MQFRDLAVGDTFDFIDPSRPGFNSFYSRCMKTSSRMYATADHPTYRYRVGTINVEVFHVQHADACPDCNDGECGGRGCQS